MLNYAEQLKSPQWKNKREEILSRDLYLCRNCFNERLIEGNSIGIAKFPESVKENTCIVFTLQPPDNKYASIFLNYSVEFLKLNEIFVYYYPEIVDKKQSNKLVAARIAKPIDSLKIQYNDYKIKNHAINSDIIWHANQQIYKARYKISEEELAPLLNKIEEYVPFSCHTWLEVNGLHIHHKYYQEGLLAWEYPSQSLITLCEQCHEEIHHKEKIQHRDQEGNIIESRFEDIFEEPTQKTI
jgi:hypothetical protein